MSKFIKGMDLSTLLELERCGAKYYLEALRVKLCDASHIQFLFFLLTNE